MKSVYAIVLSFVSLVSSGCASTRIVESAATPPANQVSLRGALITEGPSLKAVRVGPAVIHAYSAFGGGGLFVVPVSTGTDADCLAGNSPDVSPKREVIAADRNVSVRVGGNQIVCLATTTKGSFELLWHVSEEPRTAATTIAAVGLRGR